MSDFEAGVLWDLARNVTAWRALQDGQQSGHLDADGILALCRAAGLPEEACQQAARQRAEQRMDSQQPPVSTVYVHQ